MHVSSITDQSGFGSAAVHPAKKTKASFSDYLSAATASTASSTQAAATATSNTETTGTATSATQAAVASSSSSSPEQTFKDYMNETPAQRMFDSWLGSQHITKAQYAAMSPEEKQKVEARFQQYLKEKMEEKVGISSSDASAAI